MNAVNRVFFCWMLPLLGCVWLLGWWMRGRAERRRRHDATVGDVRERWP